MDVYVYCHRFSTLLWIRILTDSHSFWSAGSGNVDPDPRGPKRLTKVLVIKSLYRILFWIRIRFRIRLDKKCRIRIRIETNADPQLKDLYRIGLQVCRLIDCFFLDFVGAVKSSIDGFFYSDFSPCTNCHQINSVFCQNIPYRCSQFHSYFPWTSHLFIDGLICSDDPWTFHL